VLGCERQEIGVHGACPFSTSLGWSELFLQENRCALYALQACTLITSALARLDIGQLSVASFGGPTGTRLLHPLDEPWNDAAARSVLAQLHFDADNTLRETPMLNMIQSVGAMLERERMRSTLGGFTAARTELSQLLLIVADGYFHERDALQRAVRESTGGGSQRGVGGNGLLVVFIILDANEESVLELQSVSFKDGKPVFKRYLDSFPFPFYLVLHDIEHLPRLLADLLRQWLQLCSS
jgi:midasin